MDTVPLGIYIYISYIRYYAIRRLLKVDARDFTRPCWIVHEPRGTAPEGRTAIDPHWNTREE